MKSRPRIEAFKAQHPIFELVPSPPDRAWMDAFHDRHAYRCLPLSIANTHGWDILCPADVEIEWNGEPAKDDLKVRATGALPDGLVLDDFLRSHFTRGVVTFHTTYMFRTPPEWSILVSGPFNRPKHGIAPLTGVVESDWLPYPFTMNWIMTAPGTVAFAKGEPICTIMPIPKNYLGNWDMTIHDIADDPTMRMEHDAFRDARAGFQQRLDAQDPEAMRQAWQRHYFIGRHPDGTMVEGHVNKARLALPVDASGQRPLYAKPDPAASVTRMSFKPKAGGADLLTGGILSKAPTGSMAARPKAAAKPATDGDGARAWPPAAVQPQPLWHDDSPLAGMEARQTARNIAGRQRLRDGSLADAERVTALRDDRTGVLDFLVLPDFLTPEQCAALYGFARSDDFTRNHDQVGDDYWKSRILFYDDVRRQRPDLAATMKQANRAAIRHIVQFYRLRAPIWADTLQLVRWAEGMSMPPHADRANPDGAAHAFAHRDFASILYLNDDYDGGEVYFPALDSSLKPRAGMLVAFTGGWRHEHAVLKVTRGNRFTMPAFYSFDRAKRDRTLYGEDEA